MDCPLSARGSEQRRADNHRANDFLPARVSPRLTMGRLRARARARSPSATAPSPPPQLLFHMMIIIIIIIIIMLHCASRGGGGGGAGAGMFINYVILPTYGDKCVGCVNWSLIIIVYYFIIPSK